MSYNSEFDDVANEAEETEENEAGEEAEAAGKVLAEIDDKQVPATKAAAEDPFAEKQVAVKQAAEKQVAEKQAAEKQAAEKQVAEKQVAEKQVAEKQVAEKQVAEKQVAEKQVAEKQAAEKQVAEKQAAEKQAAEKQVAEKQVAEKITDQEMVKITQEKLQVALKQLDKQWAVLTPAERQRVNEFHSMQARVEEYTTRLAGQNQTPEERLITKLKLASVTNTLEARWSKLDPQEQEQVNRISSMQRRVEEYSNRLANLANNRRGK